MGKKKIEMLDKKMFERYANYSVKIDRYFHCINIYANNHNGLQYIHDNLDGIYNKTLELEKDGIKTDDEIKHFLLSSYLVMQNMHVTNIFSEKDECGLGDKVSDMQIFSYITCYCYQWNLFESFISYIVSNIIKEGKLSANVLKKLECNRGKTKRLLDTLNTDVFKQSPFNAILPYYDNKGNFKQVGYSELNVIRERRNSFVHSIFLKEIDIKNIMMIQKQYNDDMWILRLYAQNVFNFANELGT